ncbi:MAG: 30S ribosomal protein S8 [Bdellovibrionales bacterium]|nr:30S ribosomal protein S8 [Bdellovibrionales bacterium]
MVNDQLSDFLTRIRNAGLGRNSKVDVFNSRLNRSVAEILVNQGYVKSFKEVAVEGKTWLRLYLKFENGDLKKPVINGLKRVSKPGLRRYVHSDGIPKVVSGLGLAILSTSKGVLSDRDARKLGVGGEHLCSIW